MASNIKSRISTALKNLGRTKTAVELKAEPDKDLSDEENAILLENSTLRIQTEIQNVNKNIELVQIATKDWFELMKKMDKQDRDLESANYDAYQKHEKATEKLDEADSRLRDLKDLEMAIMVTAKIARSKADRNNRTEQRSHAQQMADISKGGSAGRASGSGTGTAIAVAPIYQLPTLRIKPFSGDKREWPAFIESFRGAIDQKQGSKAEKLNLLRTLLNGEPATLIAGFRLEDKNYEVALKLLKDTYGDKDDYVRQLHADLTNLKRCQSFEDSKQFQLELERLCRELDAAGEDIEGPPIYLMLEKKFFKPILRSILTEKAGNPTNWNTTALRKAFAEIIKRESAIKEVMTEYGLEKQSRPDFKSKGQFRSHFGNSINATLVQTKKPQMRKRQSLIQRGTTRKFERKPNNFVQSQQQISAKYNNKDQSTKVERGDTSKIPTPCAFCGGSHWNDQCEKYKTVPERYTVAREKKLCFKCLRETHTATNCPRPAKCYNCRREHPTALCRGERKAITNGVVKIPEAQLTSRKDEKQMGQYRDVTPSHLLCNAVQQPGSRVLLRTMEVTVYNPMNPKRSKTVSIFMDDGSERSFVKTDLVKELDLPIIETEECFLNSFGEQTPKHYSSNVVRIGFLGTNGDSFIFPLNEMKFMVTEMPIVALNSMDENHIQQQKFILPSSPKQPDILLGMDVRHELEIRDVNKRLPSGFTLSNSRLGRMISGLGLIEQPLSLSAQITFKQLYVGAVQNNKEIVREEDLELEEQIRTFFGLNIIGMDDNILPEDKEEVMHTFRRNLVFKDGRYECGLPWNDRKKDLPTNYKQAKARLFSTIRKLRQQNLVEEYQKILKDWEDQGIIEIVPESDHSNGPVHYLPHRAVVRMDKTTTKVRIVLDASAKPKGQRELPSLNECLHTGPLLLNELVGILLRWRRIKGVIIADLEKAFLQLGVREQDRDATRILWLNDPINADLEQIHYLKCQVFRFCRVSFGLTTSPFLLNATIREHLSYYDTELPQQIIENLYVDNILIKVEEGQNVIQLCKEARELFHQGGMELREFYCSNPSAIKYMSPQLLAKNQIETKVLGIEWINSQDRIKFQFWSFNGKKTKRKILSHIAKIYDPLGLLSPALLPAKLLLQKLFKEEFKWDDELNPNLSSEWDELMQSWKDYQGQEIIIEFSRWINEGDDIHCFVDASAKGIGIAIYQRMSEDKPQANLIFGKSLVKPSNLSETMATIPKMELQAITIGVKALRFVLKQIKVDKEKATIWTDSLCSIERIKEHKKNDRFVTNRLLKIRGQFKIKHLTSNENPSDVASRGTSPRDLNLNRLWRYGPDWLSKERLYWPKPIKEYHPEEEVMEIEEENLISKEIQVATLKKREDGSLINEGTFSSWKRLRIRVANIIRFIHKATKRIKCKGSLMIRIKEHLHCYKGQKETLLTPGSLSSKLLSLEELNAAEYYLIRKAQEQFPPPEEQQRNLKLFLEREIWKCRGRLEEAEIAEEAKYPIYLPPESWITKLIVMDRHFNLKHPSNNTLLSRIRENFWIPKGRKFIQKTIQAINIGCPECRKDKLKPYLYPDTPHFPKERLKISRPFEQAGVDYFGPIRIKDQHKCYVALYTCLVTRAIHLEIASDYTALEFLRTFRRFCARRGWPKIVLSDNATNFVLGAEYIKEVWRKEIISKATHEGVDWKFITPRAPWMGGTWERMVGITKKALKKCIGRSLLSSEEFHTIICEIEAVVNSRPLTFESDTELCRPLRPIDFLLPYRNVEINLPRTDEDPDDPDYIPRERKKSDLQQMHRWASKRIDRFWDQWKEDYLLSLRERDRSNKNKGESIPEVGDVVLIEQEETPRSHWPMGKIIKLNKGRDGLTRTAQVFAKGKIFQRAINQLYNMEIGNEDNVGKELTIAKAGIDKEKSRIQTVPSVIIMLIIFSQIVLTSGQLEQWLPQQMAEYFFDFYEPTTVSPFENKEILVQKRVLLNSITTTTHRPSTTKGKTRRRYYVTAGETFSTLATTISTTRSITTPLVTIISTTRYQPTTTTSMIKTRPEMSFNSINIHSDKIQSTTKNPLLKKGTTPGSITESSQNTEPRKPYKPRDTGRDGTPVLWCPPKGGILWHVGKSLFCKLPPSIKAIWAPLTLHLYSRIIKPQKVKDAYHCVIKKKTDRLYKNLFFDKFTIPTKEIVPIPKKVCQEMIQKKICNHAKTKKMEAKNPETWETEDPMVHDYPNPVRSLFFGATETVAINCMLQKAALYYYPHNLKLDSPIYSTEECRYTSEYCQLPDNSSLVWTTHCPRGNCQQCDYEISTSIKGEGTGKTENAAGTWISANHEEALTFASDAHQVRACGGKWIRLSDQGFGIAEEQFQKLVYQRTKRMVDESQMASEMTAEQLSLSRVLNQLYKKECQRSQQRNSNPTLQARNMLNNTALMANWIGENTLEIFSCTEIDIKNIEFRATEKCYKFIPVIVNIKHHSYNAYLDPNLRILSSNSQNVSCQSYQYHYLAINEETKQWIKIDTKAGTVQLVDKSTIHEWQDMNTKRDTPEIKFQPTIFHSWILHNESELETFIHLEERERFKDWEEKDKEYAIKRANEFGALTGGVKGEVESWIFSIWDYMVNLWMKISCGYASFLLVRDVILPLLLAYILNPILSSVRALIGWKPRWEQTIEAGTQRPIELQEIPNNPVEAQQETEILLPPSRSPWFRKSTKARCLALDVKKQIAQWKVIDEEDGGSSANESLQAGPSSRVGSVATATDQ